jgi:hypothetical protein
MARRTPAGWTYRDLVAHVAAWEVEAARRLRALRDRAALPPRMTDADVDAFNARVVEEHRLVGAEAVVDELDAAHRVLVALVRGFPDDLLADPRAQTWIAANTFSHYPEHRAELDAASAEDRRPSH